MGDSCGEQVTGSAGLVVISLGTLHLASTLDTHHISELLASRKHITQIEIKLDFGKQAGIIQ